MSYPYIPFGLALVFIVYVVYLLLIKRNVKRLKSVVTLGVLFFAIWAVMYYFIY